MILCSGCFDGLHAGHVSYLELARFVEPGEDIFVAVACDDYIRRVKHREPFYPLAARMKVLKALRVVAEVIDHGPTGAAYVIRAARPSAFVKGQDWARNGLPPDVRDACIDVGCRVEYVNSGPTYHTSDALSTHQ